MLHEEVADFLRFNPSFVKFINNLINYGNLLYNIVCKILLQISGITCYKVV